MKVLLSIKPEFVEKIFDGSKKYEFRKILFKNPEIKTVVIYASAPKKKIVGEFVIDQILSDKTEHLWEQTKDYSGITKEFYFSYFKHKKVANAIRIGNIIRYCHERSLSDFQINQAPQSFCYIKDTNSQL